MMMELDLISVIGLAIFPVLFYGGIILIIGKIIRAAYKPQAKPKTGGFVDDPFISDDDTA